MTSSYTYQSLQMKLFAQSTLFSLFKICLVLLPLVAAQPIQIQKRATYDPEAQAMKQNGPLPLGTEQKLGMAMNATMYPASVAKALAEEPVRVATTAEIEMHKFYTKLSAASYCRDVIPGGGFECKNCDQSLKLIKTFSTAIEDSNVMILRGDTQETIYVVFRGTNSIRSAIVDIVFVPVDYPDASGTKVHKGFLDSYNALRDDVLQTLDEQMNQYSSYQVAVSGHSLGGAQAVLCALDLFKTNSTRYDIDTLSLVTQGQPRVGDPPFADYVLSTKIPYERLVNNRDIVPHLPPGALNFLHAGEEFWITRNNVVEACPYGIETSNCANSIVPFTSILDHLTYFDTNLGLCL